MLPQPPIAPVETPIDVWRAAHRAAVRHLIAASYGDCDCTAERLCDVGQILEDQAEFAERRLAWRMKA